VSEREIRCLNCGKKVIDRSNTQQRKFCSKRCQSGYSHRSKQNAINNAQCLYNDGVVCIDHQCENCGWNPAIAKEREEKILHGN
jgi:hypothetical protein